VVVLLGLAANVAGGIDSATSVVALGLQIVGALLLIMGLALEWRRTRWRR